LGSSRARPWFWATEEVARLFGLGGHREMPAYLAMRLGAMAMALKDEWKMFRAGW